MEVSGNYNYSCDISSVKYSVHCTTECVALYTAFIIMERLC